MKYNKGFAPLVLVAIIVGVLAVGSGAYLVGKNQNENEKVEIINNEEKITEDFTDNIFTINSNSEESSSEVFNNQPGAIKSVKSEGPNKWVLEVDLLSNNNNWIPGVNLPFVNQNTKIRDLTVNFDTKIYECNEETKPIILVNNSNFINKLQNRISQAKNEFKNRVEGVENIMDWATAYFDINGNNITAIYEQCLP